MLLSLLGHSFWTTDTTDCSRPVFCRGDWVGVSMRGFGWVWCSRFLDGGLKLICDSYVTFNCAWNLKSPWGTRLPGCFARGLTTPLGTSSLAWGRHGMASVAVFAVFFLRMLRPCPSALGHCPGVWWHSSSSSSGSLNYTLRTSLAGSRPFATWSRAWTAFRTNPAW